MSRETDVVYDSITEVARTRPFCARRVVGGFLGVLIAAGAVACSTPPGMDDVVDGSSDGSRADGTTTDTGRPDTGTMMDGGDGGGTTDSGTIIDTGVDTGFVDTGSTDTDSGMTDTDTGVITDGGSGPSLTITPTTVAEGNTGTTSASFTVTLSAASTQTVTVAYDTTDGTATAGTDYTTSTGTLTFAPGTTTQTITVSITGDTLDETDETYTVGLSNPTGGAFVATASATGTITDDDAQPSASIAAASVVEGNTGTSTLTFNVTLSAASALPVSLNYATSDGTATTAGGDYATAMGTLTFAPGETMKTITVNVTGDAINEANETLNVDLSMPMNATIMTMRGVGTITDDDTAPTLSINDVTVREGNTATTPAAFTVTLSAASGQTVTVNYATADGTATIAGTDYAAAMGTLTFAPGETTKMVSVNVNGDTANEADETFTVNLTAPTVATIVTAQGTGTISNDDLAGSALTIGNATIAEGNNGTANLVFTVTLTPAATGAVTVGYATADGTASSTAGDYAPTSGLLTFPAGTTTRTITVPVNGDTLNEANETVLVNLTMPTNATIMAAQGTGTITDDDAVPTLAVNNVTVPEGMAGSAPATFRVSLSAPSGQAVTVAFATADGTAVTAGSAATGGADYAATMGVLTFAPGVTTQNISVAVNGDTLNEANENFRVNLTMPTNATIMTAQGMGTITNDDAPPAISIVGGSVIEGNMGPRPLVYTVTLDAPSAQTVNVNFATANGTATAGTDYVMAMGTLTFNPGVTTQTITVNVTGDMTDEPNETVLVNLSNPTNGTIATMQGTGTITNDDSPLPTLSINDVSIGEGNTGMRAVTLTVNLSAASVSPVTVNFATANGTATPADYTAAMGTLTFPAGTTSQTITVNVLGDTLDEADETVLVNLSMPSATATIADNQGIVTITDDDASPNLTIADVTVTEGNTGTTNATFVVTLSAASGRAVTVNYATAPGTAAAGTDYTSTSGTLTFPAGTTTQMITVPVLGDVGNEPNETFTVNLTGAMGGVITDNQGVGTITNDDTLPALSINDVRIAEGNFFGRMVTLTVTLSSASGQNVTVNYATANGTATAGTDYNAAMGTLTFAPGVTTQTITIFVRSDFTAEPDETVLVNLSMPSASAVIMDNQGILTIVNDD